MIEVRDLHKNYGNIEGVKGVSFQVKEGEIYGLLGSNGAGESTIVFILCGLVKPTDDSVFINGLNLFSQPLEVKQLLRVVPQ
mgnify:CR=1 FL=1